MNGRKVIRNPKPGGRRALHKRLNGEDFRREFQVVATVLSMRAEDEGIDFQTMVNVYGDGGIIVRWENGGLTLRGKNAPMPGPARWRWRLFSHSGRGA